MCMADPTTGNTTTYYNFPKQMFYFDVSGTNVSPLCMTLMELALT